jgi:nucleoside-diphosphate-sugar epimerase
VGSYLLPKLIENKFKIYALTRSNEKVPKMNCKVSNSKAKKYLDWELKYPSYEEGLKTTLKEMKEKKPYFG